VLEGKIVARDAAGCNICSSMAADWQINTLQWSLKYLLLGINWLLPF
jgi:hypothetical protein